MGMVFAVTTCMGGGKVSVHIIHKWQENAIKVTTKESVEADQWHHIFATYDGSSKAAGIRSMSMVKSGIGRSTEMTCPKQSRRKSHY